MVGGGRAGGGLALERGEEFNGACLGGGDVAVLYGFVAADGEREGGEFLGGRRRGGGRGGAGGRL